MRPHNTSAVVSSMFLGKGAKENRIRAGYNATDSNKRSDDDRVIMIDAFSVAHEAVLQQRALIIVSMGC